MNECVLGPSSGVPLSRQQSQLSDYTLTAKLRCKSTRPAPHIPRSAMKTRPRTKFTRAVNSRRCPKCGAKINNQKVRCKKCSQALTRPKK